jgi:hypothetical protein
MYTLLKALTTWKHFNWMWDSLSISEQEAWNLNDYQGNAVNVEVTTQAMMG